MKAGLIVLIVVLLSAIFLTGETILQEEEKVETSLTKRNGPVDPKELEAFLDNFLTKKMGELHIPGLAVVLVKDGKIFFSKGYGHADIEKKNPVIPDRTLFRMASVSKLFTATAIMQLYERKLLDLNADVNKYLKLFQLEENYPEPVTFVNLLTHTGGFRGSRMGVYTKRKSDQIPIGQYLTAKMPPRELPPASVISYSNQGFNLLGHLVEEISGIHFAKYIEENILHPLGMSQSSFLLLPRFLPNLAKSYRFLNGTYQTVPCEYPLYTPSPCGSLIATPVDMAAFMIAHLQDGRYGENRILDKNTLREMHKQQFTNHPRLPGMCYGFYEFKRNNQRAIFHDGDLSGFCTRLFLLPDQNLGLFIVYNSSRSRFRMELTAAFLRHYYPAQKQASPSQSLTDFKKRAKQFTGNYRSVRLRLHSFDKLGSMSGLLNIVAGEDGIKLPYSRGRWMEFEPLLFQYPGSEARMAFRADNRNRITHLFLDLEQIPIAYEKLDWYDTPAFLWISIGFIGFVFLSACVVWPVTHRIRRRRKLSAESSPPARRARLLAIFTVAMNLFFLIGVALSMFLITDELDYGVPFVLTALLVIPIITAVLTAGLPIFTFMAWKHRYWSFTERLHYSLVAFTCVGFILWLHHWNLLGLRY